MAEATVTGAAPTLTQSDGMPPPLVAFNTSTQLPLKLTSVNFVAWSFQVRTLLSGQDQLLLSTLIGSISPNLISFIASAHTAHEAWSILTSTYGKSSRGRILALKNKILNPVKGTRSITEYLLEIKTVVDELSLLGVATDAEDVVLKVLSGLDESYKELANAIQARDTPVTFEELHDKLLAAESQMAARVIASPTPATAFSADRSTGQQRSTQQRSNQPRSTGKFNSSSSRQTTPNQSAPRTVYQGRCQYCTVPGHSAKYCPEIAKITGNSKPNPSAHSVQANPPDATWVLDSGATHHITTDLANLSLHSPFEGPDSVIIGDGDGSHHGNSNSSRTAH